MRRLAARFLRLGRSAVGAPIKHAQSALSWGDKAREKLLETAREPGVQFRNAPYYDIVEPCMAEQWRELIWPRIRRLDFSHVLDLAAGHGRNSARLREVAGRITIVDINRENVDYCRERFQGDDRFTFLTNDGLSLRGVADDSISLVYSFDSMVHFDSDVMREYLKEIRRVLKPGGEQLHPPLQLHRRPEG
jgi:ubiquinone/menaquinone biosynthesis C-methylase UbiE